MTMKTEEKYITLKTSQNIFEAYFLRDYLTAAGIKARVRGEETVMNNAFYTDNLGGVEILIPENHLHEAIQLLHYLETSEKN